MTDQLEQQRIDETNIRIGIQDSSRYIVSLSECIDSINRARTDIEGAISPYRRNCGNNLQALTELLQNAEFVAINQAVGKIESCKDSIALYRSGLHL